MQCNGKNGPRRSCVRDNILNVFEHDILETENFTPNLVGLVWELAATRRSVCIHQMNRVNSRNDCVMMTAA